MGHTRGKCLIYGWDLNFTLCRDEIWGLLACEERLVDFFKNKMDSVAWVEIEPIHVSSTWTNTRGGGCGVSKWLDIFFVHRDPLQHLGIF